MQKLKLVYPFDGVVFQELGKIPYFEIFRFHFCRHKQYFFLHQKSKFTVETYTKDSLVAPGLGPQDALAMFTNLCKKTYQDQFTKKWLKLKLYPALRTLCNMIANFYCYYFSRQSEASTTTAAAVGSDVVMAEYNLDMGRWVCPTSNAEHSAISLVRLQVL